MIGHNKAAGAPCPRCNLDGTDPNPDKRIRTTLQMLLITQEAMCDFCGLRLKLTPSSENEAVIQRAAELDNVLKASSKYM